MLTAFKKAKGDWAAYETSFLALMAERRIEDRLRPDQLDGACLLCSEATPHHCHRRLACEYLGAKWSRGLSVRHLWTFVNVWRRPAPRYSRRSTPSTSRSAQGRAAWARRSAASS